MNSSKCVNWFLQSTSNVNTGSIADNAGLKAGDAVVRINSQDLYNLRHKDAQDAIVRAGPSFEMIIQRGGATWKPSVTPLSSAAPSPLPGSYAPLTKTSLAANKQPSSNFGSGHNSAAKPFNQQIPASPGRVIANKQYNTPVAMYSDEIIAETLSSQAEVLAGGVLGVNFKKNEKVYNPEKSEVLKALQENDFEPEPGNEGGERNEVMANNEIGELQKEGRATSPTVRSANGYTSERVKRHCLKNAHLFIILSLTFIVILMKRISCNSLSVSTLTLEILISYLQLGSKFYWQQSHAIGGSATSAHSPRPLTPNYQNMGNYDDRVGTTLQENKLAPTASHRPSLPVHEASKMSFQDGVFVRIKDKNLHAECFKCATCGTSLKNRGYFNVHNKLYCDIHARMVALNSPPPNSNGLAPVTFEPKNVGASAISSALNAHAGNLNGNAPSNFSAPKPFSYAPVTPSFGGPPLAAPKSPSAYTPTPAWSPPSAVAPAAPKPAGPVQGSVGTPGALPKHGKTFTTSGPNRGQGILTQPSTGRVPICGACGSQVRSDHLLPPWDVHGVQHISCVSTQVANENLLTLDLLKRKVTCIANTVSSNFWHLHAQNVMEKLRQGDCLNAIGKKFHPECFKCTYCGKLFGNSPFFLEDGAAYCEADWNELFTTKCFSCGFPVEAGDRWVEALNNNYHSQCFNCTYCKKNLEGQSFFAKGGRPFCKNHAR
ncbi:CLUMA_CG008541, isoform B [Clunio marinus]|uniref:CLUMA_CG008541, isoform B n=1 Tax=Clunio marinus TaxID=568069 RepID=A0A1J1I4D8_9DIPT|nr:CLUMA_CG008541, isoform B [Clunio marinus]